MISPLTSAWTGILPQLTQTVWHNDCLLAGLLICIYYHKLCWL